MVVYEEAWIEFSILRLVCGDVYLLQIMFDIFTSPLLEHMVIYSKLYQLVYNEFSFIYISE